MMKKHAGDVQKFFCCLDSPIGKLTVAEDGEGISDVLFGQPDGLQGMTGQKTPLLRDAAAQLHEYFHSKRQVFTLPLSLRGTEFQVAVWQALWTIPYGETRSYKQIAQQIGRPKATRAVGMANHRNPVSIIVPCHRVIGHNGSLVGYGGGLAVKDYLLRLEALTIKPGEKGGEA